MITIQADERTAQQEADGLLTRHAVREICKAHHITTLDEQDELLVRLASDRAALLSALRGMLRLGRHRKYDGYFADAMRAIAQAEAPR